MQLRWRYGKSSSKAMNYHIIPGTEGVEFGPADRRGIEVCPAKVARKLHPIHRLEQFAVVH